MFSRRLSAEAFFTHTTAALLLGAPLAWELETLPAVHVGVAAALPTPHAHGLIGHRVDVGPGQIVERRGLRMTSPARTWLDLATILELGDLVAVGDYLIQRQLPLTTVRELGSTIDAGVARRGIRRSREALALLSDRSESRPESLLRVIVVRGGLPAPKVNYVVVQTETGRDVRLDLAFVRERVVLEYQGDYHRAVTQWRSDMTRRSRLEADGWYVMELNADDVNAPEELVQRIAKVLVQR
jgi:very-short-patch-repair endonuclease